jgi:cytochrome c5
MRRILPVLLMAVPLFLLARSPQDPPQKKGPPAPKNLKVLPPDTNIRVTMMGYAAALGQQCLFCHATGANGGPDFASDENPKKITARHMIQMMNEINAKFPDGKVHVSCYTCHRGSNMPLTAPPAPQ